MMRNLINRKVIVGLLGTALLVFAAMQLVPREYEASATIVVEPQHIAPHFVQTSVTMDAGTRISMIHQQLMSAPRLQRVIDTYQLYKPMKGNRTQAEILQYMRDNIRLELIRNLPGSESNGVIAVRLSYRYTDAASTAQVTNQLASMFIETNLEDPRARRGRDSRVHRHTPRLSPRESWTIWRSGAVPPKNRPAAPLWSRGIRRLCDPITTFAP